ncbi:caspase family protein [Larkinella soli]|uniref:caspase family protein n=1 Tax=Larkinella soli TaxID=1770527 RepID=UPI000FFBAEE0|nr:caspase family protein [Larkinella soli]
MKPFLWLWMTALLAALNATGQPRKPVSARSEWVSITRSAAGSSSILWLVPQVRQLTQKQAAFRATVCIQPADSTATIRFVRNGQTVGSPERGFKRGNCREVSTEIPLQPGPNELYVTVSGMAGTATSETRLIHYLPTAGAPGIGAPTAKSTGQKRVALIIANGNYSRHPLTNPVNDGRAVREKLESLGFTVMYRENLSLRAMNDVFDTFLPQLGGQSVGLVYYAGHGLMVRGQNYMQPVDANPADEPEVEWECYALRRLIDRMEYANEGGSNLIFWDACRDNPYRSWYRGAGGKVYESVQPPYGTMVVYATEPGKPAYDGNEKNGLFTSELVRHMGEPNVDLIELVERIEQGLEARGYRQRPYIEGRLRGKFYFRTD